MWMQRPYMDRMYYALGEAYERKRWFLCSKGLMKSEDSHLISYKAIDNFTANLSSVF